MQQKHVVLLLTFIVLQFVNAFSQTSDSRAQPFPLDLEQAIQYTLDHNPGVVALHKRREIAKAEIQIAQQWNNPALLAETTRSEPNYFLGAGYLFELGGKRHNRITIAQNESNLAETALNAGLRSIRHDVRVAFYKALQSYETRDQISISRNLAEKLLDISRERFEVGDVPKIEVLQAELESKRRENDLKEAESESKSSLIELNTFLNRQPEAPVELKGSFETTPVIPSLESLTNQAVLKHLEIQSIERELTAEEARLALARSERIPDLDLEGGTEIHDADFEYGWRAALRLDLPLFNQQKGEIARTNAVMESLKAELEAAKQKTRSQIAEAYFKFEALQDQVTTYRNQILPAAKEIEDLSQESYREGKTGILSAIEAQRNMHEVRIEYLNVLMNYQTAVADLELASGTNLP